MNIQNIEEGLLIKKVSGEGNTAVFHIEGLYTGYGLTIGNSLRRALLSSIPGAAITQIKIKGVNHVFTTIPGLMEDIIELTINLKQVRFRIFSDEPQVLTLKEKGEKEITAWDIKTNPQVEVVNSGLKIATLTDKKAELDMELTVERGLGYLPSESQKFQRLPIGTIVIDAIFSPVSKINFSVENMRVGEKTDFNRLKLEIETDGSITPQEALFKAVGILKNHFFKIGQMIEVKQEDKKEESAEDMKREPAKEKKQKSSGRKKKTT